MIIQRVAGACNIETVQTKIELRWQEARQLLWSMLTCAPSSEAGNLAAAELTWAKPNRALGSSGGSLRTFPKSQQLNKSWPIR